jgi:ElaB/YqjD/DUF883 family membrane-anchored ribosome-binding protein
MRRNIFIFNVVTVILFGCLSIAQAQSDGDTVTGQDVKKETKELLTTLQQYTVGQRDQAAEEAGQALTKLDRRIGELERRIDDNWDKMTQAARQKARANMQTLREQRNELAEWYGSFKNSSAGAWEQMKEGFSDAYQAMSDSWEKAKREYDTADK